MARTMDWNRAKHNSAASGELVERRNNISTVHGAMDKIDNELYQRRLHDIISEPLAWQESKDFCQKQLDYLQQHSLYVLGAVILQKLERIEKAIQLDKYRAGRGEPVRVRDENFVKHPRAPCPRKRLLPDWMRDPSLLPKSPPSKKELNNE